MLGFKRKKKSLPLPEPPTLAKTPVLAPRDTEMFLWWPDDHSYNGKTKLADDDIAVQAVLHGERTTSDKKFLKEVKLMKKYPRTMIFYLPPGVKLEKWQREILDKMCKKVVANGFKTDVTVNLEHILS